MTGEARIRYCVEGCGSHTRGKQKSYRGEDGELGFDVYDFLVCPWCMREMEQLDPSEPDVGMVLTGHDNRRDWVKGEKWRTPSPSGDGRPGSQDTVPPDESETTKRQNKTEVKKA